jgi:Arc/MetJ-type ribon-helix-helix transcriptional regulator
MRQPELERKQLIVRLPVEVAAWVEHQVVRNGSSQSSEVLRALRDRMDREQRERAAG